MVHLVAAILCLGLGADVASATAKTEIALFDGEWSMVNGERDGQPIPADFAKQAKRVCRNGETTVSFGDQVFMKAKFTVDPSKKPKTIDYKLLEGPNKDKTVLGIYELNGDVLKFCFGGPDEKRPTEFKAKEGSGWTLSEWKRVKK